MKAQYILLILVLGLLASCRKDNIDLEYEQTPELYFGSSDSIVVSLVGVPIADTIYVPINLLGQNSDAEHEFLLSIDENLSTAQPGVHYDLPNEFFYPDSVVTYQLPIVIYSKDESLLENTFVLKLSLESNANFGIAFEDRKSYSIYITKELLKPDSWRDFFFGTYSKVKYAKLAEIAGKPLPKSSINSELEFWRAVGAKLNEYYSNNIVYDENGNLIVSW
ncbi:MAG: DUF4843 domain-containing protein [Carboxylicivirga sp.]|jgi:hypothetical protein|nr:DUF4843 domain-containing protein [Carboxylicivirga sp.]